MFARHIYNSPAGFLDSDFSILLLSSFIIFYNNYIIYFLICQGKAPHASHSQKAAQKVLEVEWFPTLPILRGAPK